MSKAIKVLAILFVAVGMALITVMITKQLVPQYSFARMLPAFFAVSVGFTAIVYGLYREFKDMFDSK